MRTNTTKRSNTNKLVTALNILFWVILIALWVWVGYSWFDVVTHNDYVGGGEMLKSWNFFVICFG